MADIEAIRALVQDAIDRGATTVEEVNQKIAAMPLDALKRFEPLADAAASAQDIAARTIGAVYDTIRSINDQVAQVAQQMLGGNNTPSE